MTEIEKRKIEIEKTLRIETKGSIVCKEAKIVSQLEEAVKIEVPLSV